MFFEPVVLEGAWGGERGDFGEADGGAEGSGFDEVVAGVEEEAGEASGSGGGLGGGEEGSAASAAAVLGDDEDAGELSIGVEAEAAGGSALGAEDEEGGEAGARELLEREVDLLLGGLSLEVADGELGEVRAEQDDGVWAVDGLFSDGPHGGQATVIG